MYVVIMNKYRLMMFVLLRLLFYSDVDGEMWCYQKPGFEGLLLAELQRQQQCSQFCDTLLKTEGIKTLTKTLLPL